MDGTPSLKLEIRVALMKAHKETWGANLVHQIDEDVRKTLCGRGPAECQGTPFYGVPSLITCRGCKQALIVIAKEIERRKQHVVWLRAYAEYQRTTTWHAKRDLVFERENYLCEGCRKETATQVHHDRYPDAWPGSPEWIDAERLWEFHALCGECHVLAHKRRDKAAAG